MMVFTMESNTWDTLEHLVETQNGEELTALLGDLIACCEIETIDKNEIIRMVIGKNNANLLEWIAPHYDLTTDTCVHFQVALYNKLDNLLDLLSPPPHMWSDLIEEMCLNQDYQSLDRWSQWAKNLNLDQEIVQKVDLDFYHPDARDLAHELHNRIDAQTTHANLTEALRGASPAVKSSKKM